MGLEGGGFIRIPFLVYIGSTPTKTATFVSMVVIIIASCFAFLGRYRRRNNHVTTSMWMGIASISCALGGALLSRIVSDQVLYYSYTGSLGVAVSMLLSPHTKDSSKAEKFRFRRLSTFLVGILRGLLTGFEKLAGGSS